MIRVRVAGMVPSLVGVVRADGIDPSVYPPGFEPRLAAALNAVSGSPDPPGEGLRQAVRDMLRHGTYRPTGRGKPASEYLVRAAREGAFPRVNSPVDVCNLVSLESLLPISLWDIDRAAADGYLVRHGRVGETYVFNRAGQVIALGDLIVGCREVGGVEADARPIVNPIKDSLETKTDERTRRVAALVYGPPAFGAQALWAVAEGFAELLAGCGDGARTVCAVVEPGSEVEL